MQQNFFLVEPSELRQLIHEELERFFDVVKTANPGTDEWVDSKDVPAYLKISRKTWQRYRDQRLIPFSQVGSKIRVRRTDLDAFLDAFTVHSIVEPQTTNGNGTN